MCIELTSFACIAWINVSAKAERESGRFLTTYILGSQFTSQLILCAILSKMEFEKIHHILFQEPSRLIAFQNEGQFLYVFFS